MKVTGVTDYIGHVYNEIKKGNDEMKSYLKSYLNTHHLFLHGYISFEKK
jgi:hypothetical protein